jgi:hypothetical protein
MSQGGGRHLSSRPRLLKEWATFKALLQEEHGAFQVYERYMGLDFALAVSGGVCPLKKQRITVCSRPPEYEEEIEDSNEDDDVEGSDN